MQAKKRQHQAHQATKLSNLCDEKPNDFWRCWKKLHRNTSTNDYIDIDKFTLHYKETDKPLIDIHFDDAFIEKISKTMDEFGDGGNVSCPDPINDILNGPIHREEVRNALKHSKNKKSMRVRWITN